MRLARWKGTLAPKKAGEDAHTAEALLAKYGKTRTRGPQCAMATHPQRPLIQELIESGMSAARVAEVMVAEFKDARLKAQAIGRHSRGECACPR